MPDSEKRCRTCVSYRNQFNGFQMVSEWCNSRHPWFPNPCPQYCREPGADDFIGEDDEIGN